MSNFLEFRCGCRKLSVRPIPNQPGYIGFIDDRVVSIAAFRWQALRGVILAALRGNAFSYRVHGVCGGLGPSRLSMRGRRLQGNLSPSCRWLAVGGVLGAPSGWMDNNRVPGDLN